MKLFERKYTTQLKALGQAKRKKERTQRLQASSFYAKLTMPFFLKHFYQCGAFKQSVSIEDIHDVYF